MIKMYSMTHHFHCGSVNRRLREALGDDKYEDLGLMYMKCDMAEDYRDIVYFLEELGLSTTIHFNTQCRILRVVHNIVFPYLPSVYPVGRNAYDETRQILINKLSSM